MMGELQEKNNELLHPCKNWSIENKCCRGLYDIITNSKYEHMKPSLDDFDKNCKGKSNSLLCVWFLFDRYTITTKRYR